MRGVTLVAGALLTLSCARDPRSIRSNSAAEQQYSLSGAVIRVDAKEQLVTIQHGRVQNAQGKVWMEPMTMEFPVKDLKELTRLQAGQRVRATVHQKDGDFEYWLGQIEIEPQQRNNNP